MAENIDPVDALNELINARLLDVNTSVPATIVSYANGRASVQPTVNKRYADGDTLPYPVIRNVRVEWPSFNGGQCGVKGPVTPGDPCLLIFSQQAVDGSDDRRMFDLSDCYTLMVNNGQVGAGQSGNNTDMVMWFGSAYIALTAGGQLNIVAPGGVDIQTPSVNNSGSLTNEKEITGQSGLAITGIHPATGTGSKVAGNFEVEGGDVVADGISLKTHKTSGVTPGSGLSGNPV